MIEREEESFLRTFFFFLGVREAGVLVVAEDVASADALKGVAKEVGSTSIVGVTIEDGAIVTCVAALAVANGVDTLLAEEEAETRASCCSLSRSLCTSLYRSRRLAFNIPPVLVMERAVNEVAFSARLFSKDVTKLLRLLLLLSI